MEKRRRGNVEDRALQGVRDRLDVFFALNALFQMIKGDVSAFRTPHEPLPLSLYVTLVVCQ
jgi:hypothetical protein